MSERIRVVVCGACGRMGQETATAVASAEDMELVAVCDAQQIGPYSSDIVGTNGIELQVQESLAKVIHQSSPQVVVDFTSPTAVMANVRTVLSAGISAVVGTTGITPEGLKEIEMLAKQYSTSAVIVPNFAIGAVLMMKFAAEAAQYLPAVEIIELHHDKKLDSPSGTALKTAEMIAEGREQELGNREPVAGGAGREFESQGVKIHCVRLPGLVAHQEVIFGGQGQTLTIRHDSIDRTSFMPGVLLAIRKSQQVKGLIYGLENIL